MSEIGYDSRQKTQMCQVRAELGCGTRRLGETKPSEIPSGCRTLYLAAFRRRSAGRSYEAHPGGGVLRRLAATGAASLCSALEDSGSELSRRETIATKAAAERALLARADQRLTALGDSFCLSVRASTTGLP